MPTLSLSASQLKRITSATIRHYNQRVGLYWEQTKDLDMSTSYQLFLSALPLRRGLRILDFGCGPGRDLMFFKSRGYEVTGLDGSEELARVARENAGCEVLVEDFLNMDLEGFTFDAIFAQASLFHIPRQALPGILQQLRAVLVEEGALFMANPTGDVEDWDLNSYGNYMDLASWVHVASEAGFKILAQEKFEVGEPWRSQEYCRILARKA